MQIIRKIRATQLQADIETQRTESCMRIIPVIDIRNSIAVRAVAGERGQYRPLATHLTESTEPAEVLKALQNEFGCGVCYVADLDGIEGRPLNRCTLAEMVRTGVHLIVDSGVQSASEAEELLDLGIAQVVVASESLPEMDRLPDFLQTAGHQSIIFSMDLKHGVLRSADPSWKDRVPIDLVRKVVEHGISQIIVLDLAAVGTGSGIPTLDLCCVIKQQWSDLKVISGGGVCSPACLESARQAGLDGLLIASALHDGRLKADDV
jgi:phosphoribosylformimino-5-aminoimidazole carboxamide ribotide isomerase